MSKKIAPLPTRKVQQGQTPLCPTISINMSVTCPCGMHELILEHPNFQRRKMISSARACSLCHAKNRPHDLSISSIEKHRFSPRIVPLFTTNSAPFQPEKHSFLAKLKIGSSL